MMGGSLERRTYSADEAAQILGVSKRTVYNLLESGQIRCIQLGKRKLIPREAVDELFAAN